MITRSQARRMASNYLKDVVEPEESQEVEINNQLGVSGIFDEGSDAIVAEMSTIRAEGQNKEPSPPTNELQQMLALMLEFKNSQEELKNNIEINNKELKDSIIEEIKNSLNNELKQIREEIRQESNLMKAETNKIISEMREDRERINRRVDETQERIERQGRMFEESLMKQSQSISNTNKMLSTNTKNISDNLNRINNEIRNEIKTCKEENLKQVKEVKTEVSKQQSEIEEQIRKLAEEKAKRIDEVQAGQESMKRRLAELEVRPNNRTQQIDLTKEVTFNGEEEYPMEFLKELREIREAYYPSEDVKWVGRHLVGEATVWWRVVKHRVTTYEEFEEMFTQKYWGQLRQEKIHHELEFGRYNPAGRMSMAMYMERKILQCRQLVPPISDQHLIKKLARHYHREVEIAVVTRGIRDINQFEALLDEFSKIQERRQYRNEELMSEPRGNAKNQQIHDNNNNYNHQCSPPWRRNENQGGRDWIKREVVGKRPTDSNKGGNVARGDYKGNHKNVGPAINTLEVENQQPSTSTAKNCQTASSTREG